MPTCITHAVVGVAAGIAITGRAAPRRFLVLSIAGAMLPDVDILAFAFGVPYDHLFGHRGITHSILFAAFAGLLIVRLFFPDARRFSRRWFLHSSYFFLIILLHAVLDAFTNGGEGAAFLAPFSNRRFFFHFTPIEVSPVNMLHFFDGRGWTIIVNEMIWIWGPLFTAAFLVRFGIKADSGNRARGPEGNTPVAGKKVGMSKSGADL